MEPYPIIVLNGSSCAGKSSIAYELQKKLNNKCAVVSYDDFRRDFFTQHYKSLGLLPDDYVYTQATAFFDDIKKRLSALIESDRKTKELEVRTFCQQANDAFYNHIHVLSCSKEVIVDTIFLSEQQKMVIAKKLGNTMKTVFIHVPFSAIVDRIKKRNAISAEQSRYANRVLSIYPEFYMIHEQGNLHISMEEIKSTIQHIEFLPSSVEFPTGNLLIEKTAEAFGIQHTKQQEKIRLVPRLSHDLIVDTSTQTPEQCALFLLNNVMKS